MRLIFLIVALALSARAEFLRADLSIFGMD